jgi:hypothetical protein
MMMPSPTGLLLLGALAVALALQAARDALVAHCVEHAVEYIQRCLRV